MKGETPMGIKDMTTSEYLRQNHIFADAFNFYIYGGRSVIDPASLHELDTREIVIPSDSENGSDEPIQRFRDSMKYMSAMSDGQGAYVVFAVESQSYIDYAMPARTILYDAMQYSKQVKEIATKHKLDGSYKKASSDEFTSGFYKGDTLLPVITLVIYFADKEWDGPMSLRDMFQNTNDRLLSFVQDYKINLIAPTQIRDDEFDLFHSSLKEVLLFIKYAKDKKRVRELVENNEAYHHMSQDAVKVINVCTGANLQIREEEKTINMCQAINDLIADAVTSAKAETASAKAEATSAKAEATSAKAEATSAKAEATSAKAEATSAKAEATSAKAETAKVTEEKISILLKSIKVVMKATGMPLEQTLSALDISKSDQEKVLPLL
jgi:hypothetical protein